MGVACTLRALALAESWAFADNSYADIWLNGAPAEPGPCVYTLECPVFPVLAGSPSRLSVGEQPEVTHDPYEFLQSPEPAASTKS